MTKGIVTDNDFAQFASQMKRNPHTLARLRELMKDAERKRDISERIKALRERRGLTQPQVAREVGAELRTYQNWESGGGTSHENYERLAEVLGCSYDYLVTGAEVSPPAEDILSRLDAIDEAVDEQTAKLAELVAVVSALQSDLQRPRTPRRRGGDAGAGSVG
jgi:transcriptional regulator with XRE-family HTH domain